MALRKINKTYYFSVEGETEQWYLEWLQRKINECQISTHNVSIKSAVEKNPVSYIKSLSVLSKSQSSKSEIYHLSDYESNDDEHLINFQATMDRMREAEKLKSIRYKFGYSNFSFELWIILHKADCFGRLTNRKDYLKKINDAFGVKFINLDVYKQEDNFKALLNKCTLDDVISAISRSKKIMTNNEKAGYRQKQYKNFLYYEENPSLMVWKAVEKILSETGCIKKK